MDRDKPFRCVDGCTRCCTDTGHPLELTLGDIIRLCGHLSTSGPDFFESYCEIVWNMAPSSTVLVPGIGLKFPCAFLEGGKCSVYDIRPIHCRLFPEALVADNCNLDIYHGSGYECMDAGFRLNAHMKGHINWLKDIDGQELRVTASYFGNFNYCVELNEAKVRDINGFLSQAGTIERASLRRKLYCDMIKAKHRGNVKSAFVKMMEKINAELFVGGN